MILFKSEIWNPALFMDRQNMEVKNQMEITAEMVKDLRRKTNAGVMDCKKALTETNGDVDAAIEWLRRKGLETFESKQNKPASEGIITSYIHAGSKIGVLLELNCQTDFVARTEEFQQLAKDIAMQVAARNPKFITREDVPEELIEKEKEIRKEQALNEGKPERVVDKIVEGRMGKLFFSEVCLMEQDFIRDDKKSVADHIKENAGILGENIVVRRYIRYLLGE